MIGDRPPQDMVAVHLRHWSYISRMDHYTHTKMKPADFPSGGM